MASSSDLEKKQVVLDSSLNDARSTSEGEVTHAQTTLFDRATERKYLRKLDLWLLPFLSLMYFFNSIDRSNLGNAETDKMGDDLKFVGQEYSLLVLLFYIPNGLCDLPLNMLTKRFSGKIMLPLLMTGWGALAMLQVACTNFAGMLVVRLLLAALEAGFFAGAVFYLTLFYTRGELAFRIALFFGSALLAGAFSGLLAFGVFQIADPHIHGWMWLFIIEGGMTVVLGVVAFFWLPATPSTAWFLTEDEKAVAKARHLRDGSGRVGEDFKFKDCFRTWNDPMFAVWCIISFTYPVAFSTTANFLPLILKRLRFSTVVTNLLTVPPNLVGFIVLLVVTRSSDKHRERSFHIIGALCLSLAGLIILAAVPPNTKSVDIGVAYFACFLLCSGAYIPSCLVHSWHNNNNLNETSRAATTGLLVGLGNLGGILSGATFRTTYAPRYVPTLVATAACNVTCICFTFGLGLWMRRVNKRRDQEQGTTLKADDVDTREMSESGTKDPRWRYFV
ncbi:hypothetical protein VM1G_02428 [Cytospora mali]|uniref:Major facilitator superfamily (MFS) profile domain-containing protein n=1 Tax=Cytospora mali TaxID=578113 RepID=A0A194VQH8_CYTMA|nr:hypothetical protein VM1G_02428 [Valsa mali]